MAWQTLATITLSDFWQFTQAVESDYFRIGFVEAVNLAGKGYVCQANTASSDRQIFQVSPIQPRAEKEIFYLPKPYYLPSRVIGVKAKVFAPLQQWTVQIDYWDVIESPYTPSLPSVIDAGEF